MAGRLRRGMPAGSFEQGCEWVRDPLLALGCRDPIEATRQAKRADPERRELAELFGTWSRVHGEEPVAAKDLDEAILSVINPQKRQTIRDADAAKNGGRALRRFRADRVQGRQALGADLRTAGARRARNPRNSRMFGDPTREGKQQGRKRDEPGKRN